jgi:hypothetical protein
LEKAAETDPLVVKAAYHSLFEAILVQPGKDEGQINLSFILRDSESDVSVTIEAKTRDKGENGGPCGP